MINGYTGTGNGTYGHNFAASGDVGGVGIPGLTAELQGSTGVTLTADKPGTAGNSIAITNAAGDVAQATALAGGHNGKLGVGTSSPSALLHISGTMENETLLHVQDYLYTNPRHLLFVSSSGAVGIGTTAPIAGTAASTTPGGLHIQHVDSTAWVPTVGGDMGNYLLVLKNTTNTVDAYAGIAFDVNTEDDTNSIGAAIAAVNDNSTSTLHDANLVFSTNDAGDATLTERMRINPQGEVGIGQADPGSLLHLTNDTAAIITVESYSNTALNDPGVRFIRGKGHSGGKSMVVDTNPLGFIQWDAYDGVDTLSTAASIVVEVDGTAFANDIPGRMIFSTTADGDNEPTERIRIDNAGNVGIGTTSPASLLHVSDTETASGDDVIRFLRPSLASGNYYSIGFGRALAAGESAFFEYHYNSTTADSFVGIGNYGDAVDGGVGLIVRKGGNVGIGNTAPGSLLEVSKVSGDASIELSSWSATDGDSGTLIFQKSSIATVNTFGDGSGTAASETLGRIEGWGATQDLTAADDIAKLSSYIEFANDAASREGTVPGKIVFATAPNSDDATPAIRLTIDDGGLATFANSVAITTDLDVDGTANLDAVDIDGAVAIDPGASSGVGLTLTHTDTDAIAYAIAASNQDADVMTITADALTTGDGLNITSNSSNNNSRKLLGITNSHASAGSAILLHLTNAAVAGASNVAIIESSAAETGAMLEMKNTNTATDKPITLNFTRDSTTVADDMNLGKIAFEGKDSAGSATDYATIAADATDVTNQDEGGKLTFSVRAGGTAGTAASTNLFSIGGEDVANSTQCEVVVNDAGINCDFRVEGDNVTSLFHIDASADKIGIGNSTPGSTLEVTTTAANSESTRPTIEISSFSDADDASTSAGALKFHKSANDTINTYGADSHTAADEVIGRIEAWGVTNADDTSSDAPKLSSYIEFAGDAVADETDVPGKIIFATADADDNGTPTVRLTIDDAGHVTPGGDNTQDLGSSSYRWANLYTGDLHLKNERGDWTIVEEEEYLCVVNNKTGKKYKMMLQEIEGGE